MNAKTIAILAAAVLSPAAMLHAQATTQPVDAQANVPVREVVLFSSGVGYFEHYGQINGNSATVLRFKSEQINDILKSLILEDLDKGHVSAVTYPSQGPLERTLRSFQIDLTQNPALSDLLNQLRGAQVSVTLALGARHVEGTVLGVEKQQRPSGDKEHPQPVEVNVVNLVSDAGIQPIELSQISDVHIEDAELRRELAQALAAVAQARDKDKKPVEIHFSGNGDRRVRIGYVVETPVWKTSYRLILPSATDPIAPEDRKANNVPHAAQGSIQGWAIVENQTDSDWKDVQLSLVSGRPISFIQDLYQPLYIPRPTVQPELYASLRPQTYEGGMADARKAEEMTLEARPKQQMQQAAQQLQLRRSLVGRESAPMASAAAGLSDGATDRQEARDFTSSIASVASAAKVGELFQYTVGNVSIARQQSAMLPIVTDSIESQKLSIYNQSVLAGNPLLGARLKNTTGKYLLQGPVTVISGGSYAGDASLGDVPPGQERLISYGIDQEVTVHASDNTQANKLLTGKIVKGVLQLTYKQTFSQEFTAEDKSESPKTLLIEAPKLKDWTLLEPKKPIETTDTLYRFEGALKPHQPSKLAVREEHVQLQEIGILPLETVAVEVYARTGEIPQDVKDALAKAAQLKGALTDAQRQVQQRQQKTTEITAEQSRIRENMKAVSPASDYYKRLLTELDEQETTIQDLHKQVQDLQKQQEQQRKALEDYLSSLSVG